MTTGFQTAVNIEQGFGVPGALYDDSPVRAAPYTMVSASAAYNIVGSTACTVVTADPGDNSTSAVAKAGGTGVFAGIIANSKVYSTSGTTAGALNPSMTLPNYTVAELISMAHLIVGIPGPANVGDPVAFDRVTGELSTFPKTTSFTAAMATTGALTVSVVVAGMLQVGQLISGTDVPPGTYITSAGSATGNTGTYQTNYTGSAIAAEAMSAPSLPPPAAAATATFLTTGVFTATAVASGQLSIGTILYGTGLPAQGVAIIGLGTGIGGTGTYSYAPASSATLAGVSVTADALTQIAGAEVIQFAPPGATVGVISLTGA